METFGRQIIICARARHELHSAVLIYSNITKSISVIWKLVVDVCDCPRRSAGLGVLGLCRLEGSILLCYCSVLCGYGCLVCVLLTVLNSLGGSKTVDVLKLSGCVVLYRVCEKN